MSEIKFSDTELAGGPCDGIPEMFYMATRITNESDDYIGSISGYMRPEVIALVKAAPALLALARQYASECAECDGSAEIVRNDRGGDPIHDYAKPCDACEDIRAVIASCGVAS